MALDDEIDKSKKERFTLGKSSHYFLLNEDLRSFS